MKNKLGRAIAITAEAFQNTEDKGGVPYICHCLHVMNAVAWAGQEVQQAAVMHDLLEDTHLNEGDLKCVGFSEEVIAAVTAISKVVGEPYRTYIERVMANPWATVIKMADLEHNSQLTRLKGVRDKDVARAIKYQKAYLKLKAAHEEHLLKGEFNYGTSNS